MRLFKSKFIAGVVVGVLAVIAIMAVGVESFALYHGLDLNDIYIYNSNGLKSIYIVNAPEQRSHIQAQSLMEANMIVLNIALEKPNEMTRVLALKRWAVVLLCGVAPDDTKCTDKNVFDVPGIERL